MKQAPLVKLRQGYGDPNRIGIVLGEPIFVMGLQNSVASGYFTPACALDN